MQGGINFISPEQRIEFDNKLIIIATQLLSLTKQNGNTSKDYDYNCALGGIKSQLNSLSNKIDDLRVSDIEAKRNIWGQTN